MINIILSNSEAFHAATCGILRTLDAKSKKRKDTNGQDWNWQIDIDGCLAEMAFAKAFRYQFPFEITPSKGPDIGEFEIKHTRLLDGCLIIKHWDRGNHYYILVIGCGLEYKIIGGILGSNGKRKEFERQPNTREPAWYIPQENLIPIEEFLACD